MVRWLKNWWLSHQFEKDELFDRRPQSAVGFGKWVLVELGATEYILVVDTLQQIHHTKSSLEDKGRQILGLRLQVLAMSARTKAGKIPLNWRKKEDLMWLASLPYSETIKPLAAIAELSDMPWVDPLWESTAPKNDEVKEDQTEEDQPSNSVNPS